MRKLNRTATTSTPTVAKLTRKADPKPLRSLSKKKSLPTTTPVRPTMSTYTGLLKKYSPHPTNEHLVLIPVTEAPGDPHFVPVDTLRTPPETYYVFDRNKQAIVHMASVCGSSFVAWDTDRDGRYFRQTRAQRLACPRSVEYCYDSATAIANGEDWSPVHPNYKGTMGQKRRSDSSPELFATKPLKKAQQATQPAKKALPKARHGVTVKTDGPKKLKRVVPVDDGGILSESGLDQSKLNSAAEGMADKYADAFPMHGGATKPLRKMRKL